MFNRKGQEGTSIGNIVMVLVGVVVCVVLFTSSAQEAVPNTVLHTANYSVTAPTSNNTLSLTGRELVGDILILNGTNIALTGTSSLNFTAGSKIIDDDLTVYIETEDAAYAGTSVDVSYTYKPDGYFDSSASRSMINIILIFAALGIAIFTLNQMGVLKLFGKQ